MAVGSRCDLSYAGQLPTARTFGRVPALKYIGWYAIVVVQFIVLHSGCEPTKHLDG